MRKKDTDNIPLKRYKSIKNRILIIWNNTYQLFQISCQLNVIENAAKLTQDVNKKIVYDHKKNAIGLAPNFPNYSLPPEDRILEIKDEEVRKYQRKAQEWIMNGGSKLTFMQN